ncbi:MAG: tetratricopeptide repeat protein [Robiginitomaculum sp.]|nr:tetratricopeptide repeat protein [Robiginitomaculum sp.]
MRNLFLLVGTLVMLSLSNQAFAELRDVVFTAKTDTAQIMFSFDKQPSAVKVFITDDGMDVDILGVDNSAASLSPVSSSLISSLRIIPAPGGLRLRIKLSDPALSATADVYRGAILVTAVFARNIEQKPRVLLAANPVVPISKTTIVPQQKPKAATTQKKQPTDDKPTIADIQPETETNSGSDGEDQLQRAPISKPLGTGMIREASLKVAGNLSQQQCDELEQAISVDPWALDKLARFGSCLAREGKDKEAREVFERLLTFDPETFAAYIGLGAIAQDNGDEKTARKYYEEALSLGGGDQQAAQARHLLGSLEGE